MIQHVVAFDPRSAAASELADVMQGLAGLVGRIEGFITFSHGPNIDAEGKTPDYPYGFIASFSDRTALENYASDPRHRALGERLVALCAQGAEGIAVFDFECTRMTK